MEADESKSTDDTEEMDISEKSEAMDMNLDLDFVCQLEVDIDEI